MDKAYDGFLQSQLLWKGEAYGIVQFELPTPLSDLSLLPPLDIKRRLGHQAEFVFLQLLIASKKYEILGHSLQLIDQKSTLGELDYVVREIATQEIIHIELTYKFYLLDNSIKDPIARLVGPNRKDTFVAKIDKTIKKQLPLLYSTPSRVILERLGIEVGKIVQRVAFYGHIFIPYGSSSIKIDPLNEGCIDGYWVNYDQFDFKEFDEHLYYQPKKYEWLHIPHLEREWKSHLDVLKEIQESIENNRSPMLWMRKRTGSIIKIFVTPSTNSV